MIKGKFCEDCNRFKPNGFEQGYCEVYKCNEPRQRPSGACSDFSCTLKGTSHCDTCTNKEECKDDNQE